MASENSETPVLPVDIHRPPLPLYWLPPQPSLFAIPEKRVQCVSVTMDQASIVLSVAFPCIVFRRQRRNRVKNACPRSFNSEANEQPIAYRSERFSAMFALRFRNSSTSVSTREKQYSGPIALFSIISFCGERTHREFHLKFRPFPCDYRDVGNRVRVIGLRPQYFEQRPKHPVTFHPHLPNKTLAFGIVFCVVFMGKIERIALTHYAPPSCNTGLARLDKISLIATAVLRFYPKIRNDYPFVTQITNNAPRV